MQRELFAETEASIAGLRYQSDFLSADEEAHLLTIVSTLPMHAARYKQYEARRRVASFGGSYDFDANKLLPGVRLDDRLLALRNRVADWMGADGEELVHVLVAEYSPGTPLGWHRDVPDFEAIAGVSLGTDAVLRFRPYPPNELAKRNVVHLEAAPRSIYLMAGPARWAWQHCVAPVKAPRWSITFRTRRAATPQGGR